MTTNPIDSERAAINAALRNRGGLPETPAVPRAISDAHDKLKSAIAAGDEQAITLADQEMDSIGAALDAPPPRDWGQGARGTGSQSNEPDMNSAIRTARNPFTK